MSLTGDVPFSEFLAPGQDAAGVVRVPPPAYARRPNFSFSLSSITNGSRNIQLSPQTEFDATELAQSSSLDYAQARAVVDSLTQSFALIQGPPGTGKSYTGIALIKVLLDNRTAANLGPIVCVCYTNHALDQLLEHLVDAGISQVIRVGSRSKSEVLKPLLLREVAMKLERTKTEKRVFWDIGKQLERDEREIEQLITALGNADSWQSRRLLHLHWTNLLREKIQRKLVHALHEYNDRRAQQDLNRLELNLRCLQEAHIIGITTSGLARNLDILRRVRAKVMVCEEAGEVMESHTLTAMLPSVEHAILIGDHEQLRPQIQRYDLGREHPRGEQYSLDVSLFERLRRMHPMISQLVRDTLYPALHDAPSTTEYPMVPGMKDRLFWFDHREHEAGSDQPRDVTSTSRTNDFEVEMTVGLVSHLMKQGIYHAEDIAVLTPYLGQLHKLRARLGAMWELVINDRDLDELEKAGIATEQVCKTTALQALKVATIDNFQGEEAKVVIISLVRSNEMNNCGFLKTSNRINVLLSRAQHGMFIIGNSKTAGSVEMWQDVLDILRAGGNIGTSFELQCPRHPPCPEAKFCQVCAADKIKDQQVDFIEMLTYKEVDLNEDPCLFPPCGHIMTMANMDGHMDMNKHYVTAPDGTFVGLKPAPLFSSDELKACPTCRGALRSISRYGRVVRRALLDESTKKFIVWSQNEYLRLQTQFQDAHSELNNTADAVVVNTVAPVALTIAGSPYVLFDYIKDTAAALNLTGRYKALFALRTQLLAHVNKVQHEEQPFRKVHDFCQDARRRRGHDDIASAFALSPEVLQTGAHLLASALLLRCDLALIADLVAIWRNKLPAKLRGGNCTLHFSSIRNRCLALLQDADAAHSPAQKVEALLFHAQSNAIQRLPFAGATATPAATTMQSQQLREEALSHIATARAICTLHPSSTSGLDDEADTLEKMLRQESTFFAVVTSEERRAVLAAMAAEFRGTGHWYYCANGHPFTVGECGMPMQLAVCPQCGAAAGGQGHVPAEGVTRAEDLERELGELRL
ncbi:putative nf-x1 finger and helicase domain [Diplodia seriata]|uniref:Putative nf-x1 finger and helicase domain n=1 Tax=Diplodia seriata TaxID=420778 RepID=A0A0G2F3U9_9PEZI|nr:putative nf-x1 finger and helicase domain [Diplodia seriata]